MGATGKRGVVAIARRGERFLAIRRGRAVAAPGRVCFPGGHVEPGEDEREAVVRECREELRAHVAAVEHGENLGIRPLCSGGGGH